MQHPGHNEDFAGMPRQMNWVVILGILLIASWSNMPLFDGQFHGEDEAGQLFDCQQIISALLHDPFPSAAIETGKILSFSYHPPLRRLLCLPGVLIFPNSEFGLRILAIIFSLFMTYQAIKLGGDIGGRLVGYLSGLFIACSAVYNWTSMAFGWSVTVSILIMTMRLLRKECLNVTQPEGVKAIHGINLLLIIAFLINTGNGLFFLSTITILIAANRAHWRELARHLAPYFLFYFAYIAYFFILVPFVALYRYGRDPTATGQLFQHLKRAEGHLGYETLISNLEGVNAYFLPYMGLLLLALSLYYLTRYERRVLVWVSYFVLAWSFWFVHNTQQYFLLVFISVVPFGVNALVELTKSKRALLFSAFVFSISLVSWNYFLFHKKYGELDYPYILLEMGLGTAERIHNIVMPYEKIARDVETFIEDDGLFVHDISGSFSMFYYKDIVDELHHSMYAGQLGSESYSVRLDVDHDCYRISGLAGGNVKIAVTRRELCVDDYRYRIDYRSSRIKTYILRNEPR